LQIFFAEFRRRTVTTELERILNIERANEQILIDRRFVDEDEERFSKWKDRIEEIRESKKRLARIYLDYESFEFPYRYEDRQNVSDVYESLADSLALARNESVVVRKIHDAIEMSNLGELSLTANQLVDLRAMFSQ
jgi:5'-3' exonuclease